MKIAIPLSGGLLAQHFGHCEQIALVDADPSSKTILSTTIETAPPHEHGVLPRLIAARGAELVIAGGIGAGAVALLRQAGIQVVAGAASRPVEDVVKDYLTGQLVCGSGTCNHHHGCH